MHAPYLQDYTGNPTYWIILRLELKRVCFQISKGKVLLKLDKVVFTNRIFFSILSDKIIFYVLSRILNCEKH